MIDKPVKQRDIFFKKRRLGEDETESTHQAWAALGDEEKFAHARHRDHRPDADATLCHPGAYDSRYPHLMQRNV
jgi:hypothetical protein